MNALDSDEDSGDSDSSQVLYHSEDAIASDSNSKYFSSLLFQFCAVVVTICSFERNIIAVKSKQ